MNEETKEVIKKIIKYIRRQNFNGSPYYLKSNIINYLIDLKNEKE